MLYNSIDVVEGECDDEKDSSGDNPELGMGNVGGVFLVLIVGCAAGIFIGILEFLWNIRTVAIEEKITPSQAFKKELLFALDIRIRSKPIHVQQTDDSQSHKSNKSIISNKDSLKPNNNLFKDDDKDI